MSLPEHSSTPPMAMANATQRTALIRSRMNSHAKKAVHGGMASMIIAALLAVDMRVPHVISTCPGNTPSSANTRNSRMSDFRRWAGAAIFRSARISGYNMMVASVIGPHTVNSEPTWSCTSFTQVNCRAHIRLQRKRNIHDRIRAGSLDCTIMEQARLRRTAQPRYPRRFGSVNWTHTSSGGNAFRGAQVRRRRVFHPSESEPPRNGLRRLLNRYGQRGEVVGSDLRCVARHADGRYCLSFIVKNAAADAAISDFAFFIVKAVSLLPDLCYFGL